MDFLIGVMLVIISILLILNFASISISDSKFGSDSCPATPNFLITTMQNGQLGRTPMPVSAGGNGKSASNINPNGYNYNYSKYFYVS